MARLRGRPVIPMPVHPERVISRAIKTGLSATIELQRNISNSITKKYYDNSHNTWRIRQQVYQRTKELGTPDFSYIEKAEPSIRNNTRQMFYENAAKYGFTEVSRQRNSDDTVDSLNQRINANGVVVRENSEIMFPIPDPVGFGTYTRRDGKGRKKYRRAGYEGSSFGPRVTLAHPDLPSLDFGDAVRSHNEYLATFCVIHDVPVRETTRYSHLFFLLARPYLEYLYSEFKCGKANFQKGVNWALRQVKELILEAGYQPTMHVKRTVTKELEFEDPKNEEENKVFFEDQEREAREVYGDHPAVNELGRLRGEEKKDDSQDDDGAIFTEKDVEYIRNKAAKRARVAGSIMHRRIANLFPSPWHLNDVIHAGDRYTRSSDYIIISEVPLQTQHGAGKVDLILCERTITADGKRVLGKPVFALEIKTRLGQSWYFDANYKESEVRPDGSPLQRVVCGFPLSDHSLSDDMWDSIVNSTPTPSARIQLDTYCQALTELHENTIQQELGQVLKGVVVIDSASDVSEIRRILERLIVYAYESVKNRVRRLKRTVFTPPKSDNSRIALVVDEQPALRREGEGVIQTPWEPTYTPFKSQKKAKRKFMLYLAGHSPTSAGQSAAWNARYSHGFQMLYEISKTQDTAESVWIDLANQFNEPGLAEARLRLRSRGYSEDEIAKVQPDHIREFFENIKVKGYLDDILAFLYKDGEIPSFDLSTKENAGKVIIITGTDTLRDATPTSHREKLTVLIDHLLGSLPNNDETIIVWFDAPSPSVEKTIPYSSRALIPFYETSSIGEVVNEIVWNLPIAPRGTLQPEKWGLPIIGDSPMHDDIRVIIRHTPTDFQMELIHVPLLRGWSKRFRNKGTGLVTRERDIDDIVPDRSLRYRMKLFSLTMIPWLVKLWPQETLVEDSAETLEEQFNQLNPENHGGNEPLTITKTALNEPPCRPPSLLNLVKFRLPETMDALSYQMMTAGKINSQRLYRAPRKLQTQPLQQVPESRITEEGFVVEEELEQEWLFGIKFESDGDPVPWWIVFQDPVHPSRMLVGCFTDRPPDKDGFLWAENKQEMMTQSSLDEILSFTQTRIIGRKKEDGLEVWSSSDGGDVVHEGILELRGQGRSTTCHLRAIRQINTNEPGTRPPSTTRPSESFYGRMIDSLRRYLAAVTSPTPVSLRLEMVKDVCHVILKDDEDNEIQEITIEYTADLISLLRWPVTKGGPMFTDSGEYVIWSIFDDIAYGDLDFIQPYVTFTAARKTPQELPKQVSQFFEETESLSVSIMHDTSICPIALGEELEHGACWRIILMSDYPHHVRKQFAKPLTGEEVNGLLAPGRLYTGRLYIIDITPPQVSEKNESIVFHEERFIRILLRNLGLSLKRQEPGTYLEITDQSWRVSIEWDEPYFRWRAQSTLSALFLTGGNQTIELIHGHGADEECKRLLNIITSHIPQVRIIDYTDLKERVLSGLKNRGYSKTSPECELKFIEQSESVCQYGIFLSDGSRSEPLLTSTVDATETRSADIVIEEIARGLVSSDLSGYNIRNTEIFLEKISTWVNKHVVEIEESEEPTEWTVTLSVDVGSGEIYWVAEQESGNLRQNGVIYTDPEELQGLSQIKASEEVKCILEVEVVPQLGIIANLDEVMDEQIPDMVKSLRSGRN